jgi:hypothetical protein
VHEDDDVDATSLHEQDLLEESRAEQYGAKWKLHNIVVMLDVGQS